MKRLLLLCGCLWAVLAVWEQEKTIPEYFIYGTVGDHVTHEALADVRIELMDTDCVVLGTHVSELDNNIAEVRNAWWLGVPRPGTFLLRFTKEGYRTKVVPVTVKKLSRRMPAILIPPVYLTRAPKVQNLSEAVVKATKIKFYNRGDTLVYNADAFQLQEGSMLDALIRQLPGAELKDDGRILVNGRQVESLLLNGEDFFRNDRSILLDNLPTYMVKTVQVYDKAGKLSEMVGHDMGDKELMMDVRLKKQYSIGWIANAETAGGTEERYLVRLFALRFTSHSRLSFFGAVNNVNEYVRPGEGSEWTPSVGNGLTTTRHAGLNYLVDDRNKRFKLQGDAEVRHSDDAYDQRSTSVNFLSGGDTYGRSSYRNRTHNVSFITFHTWDVNRAKWKLSLRPWLTYIKTRQTEGQLSGTFATDPGEYMGSEVLDSLFRPGLDSRVLAATLNRYRSDQRYGGHTLNTRFDAYAVIDVPGSSFEKITVRGSGGYDEENHRRFTHQLYDYPVDATASTDFRNEYAPTKRRAYSYEAAVSYLYAFPHANAWIEPYYQYGNTRSRNRNGLMRLDWLGDEWGAGTAHAPGVLPSVADWAQQTLDGRNSLYTTERVDGHSVGLQLHKSPMGNSFWSYSVNLPLTFERNRLAYERPAVVDTALTRHVVHFRPTFDLKNSWYVKDKNGEVVAMHRWGLKYTLKSDAPVQSYDIDVVDDSNPLAVTLGNPGLRQTWQHAANTWYQWSRPGTQHLVGLNAAYGITQNAVTMGYVYDRTTGGRTYRPENVNGNWYASGGMNFSTPLDKPRRLTLSGNTSASFNQNVDFIGIEGEYDARRSTVHNLYLTQGLRLDYRIDKYQFGAKANGTWTHATSRREDFRTINAADFSYGVTAKLDLPADFQLSTDLTVYSRRGYEDPEMNTTDVVWNARLAKRFLKGKLSVMIDGFDLLGQLSTIRRTLNGQGRTETWYNTIPRYAMLHAIYRLNVKPRKK